MMSELNQIDSHTKKMANRDFKRLSNFIENEVGIKMPSSKKIMLESRLQKRLRTLNLNTFSEYCEFLFSSDGQNKELAHMVDAVTTNKTDFFREPAHFTYLNNVALPELLKTHQKRFLNIWSAGCSYGDEPYTIAIVLSEFAENNSNFQFSILATDISSRVLNSAKDGIYKLEKVNPVPISLKKKYILKSRDQNKKLVKMVPELRRKINFQRLNLMANFKIREKMDVIFCRNVIIYFNRDIQEKLLKKFSNQLNFDGYLFLGHSETLNGLDVPFTQVAPTIYRKISNK